MRRPPFSKSFGCFLLAAILISSGCAARRTAPAPDHPPAHALPDQAAPSFQFDDAKLREIDALIAQTIQSNLTPGVVVWIEHKGRRHTKSFGNKSVEPQVEPMTEDTIFDAASLTKVMATGPAIMLLAQDGKIQLDAPVAKYIPEFTGDGRENITVKHLLTHTSGLRAGISAPPWTGREKGFELAHAEKPIDPPEKVFRYSDVNFILLGELVERVSGMPLSDFCRARIYEPLSMRDTGYLPDPNTLARIAPTEKVGGEVLRGVVHDPTSRRMGGVTGHAGLFTTAADLARFARMMLNEGELEGARIFTPATLQAMVAVQSPPGLPERGFSWDINSPYAGVRGKIFPIGSYGHTGWTGCSLWIDPASQTFVILMANRNHPSGGNVIALRSRVSTLAAEAIGLAPPVAQ